MNEKSESIKDTDILDGSVSLSHDRPAQVEVEAGKRYLWCSCGKSKTVPFCDNSHVGTKYKPVPYNATENKVESFCGCSGTGNKPFCDGTHQFKFGSGRDAYYDRYN